MGVGFPPGKPGNGACPGLAGSLFSRCNSCTSANSVAVFVVFVVFVAVFVTVAHGLVVSVLPVGVFHAVLVFNQSVIVRSRVRLLPRLTRTKAETTSCQVRAISPNANAKSGLLLQYGG